MEEIPDPTILPASEPSLLGSESESGLSSSPPTYHQTTRTVTYGFLMALPLFIAHEVFILMGDGEAVRTSAEMMMAQGLEYVRDMVSVEAVTNMHIAAVLALLTGFVVFLYERKKLVSWRRALRFVPWTILESTIYAAVLVVIIFYVTRGFMEIPSMMHVTQTYEPGTWGKLVRSIGAGVYEELFFRALILWGIFLALRIVSSLGHYITRVPLVGIISSTKVLVYVVAVVVGALTFSAYVSSPDPSGEMSSVVFWTFFGLAFNVLFLVRGFGVVAWTHALHNVFVVLMGIW